MTSDPCVPCDHEYLNFKDARLSKGRGTFVEVPYFLNRHNPGPLRFCLTATAPEMRDTEACSEGIEGFSWEDFVERNNHVPSANEGNELVATALLSSPKPGATWPTPEGIPVL